ncbi:unnamed protein product, partial [Rotaria sp. Silwood2]
MATDAGKTQTTAINTVKCDVAE